MGCRAIVYFTDSVKIAQERTSVGVYLHSTGDQITDFVRELRRQMHGRPNDADYAAARFCQIACNNHHTPNTGVGLCDAYVGGSFEALSPGDYGVVLVDTRNDFFITQFGHIDGYDLEQA